MGAWEQFSSYYHCPCEKGAVELITYSSNHLVKNEKIVRCLCEKCDVQYMFSIKDPDITFISKSEHTNYLELCVQHAAATSDLLIQMSTLVKDEWDRHFDDCKRKNGSHIKKRIEEKLKRLHYPRYVKTISDALACFLRLKLTDVQYIQKMLGTQYNWIKCKHEHVLGLKALAVYPKSQKLQPY